MKKIALIAALSVSLIGCSSTAKNKWQGGEVGFTMPDGALTIIINDQGQFISAKSTASAQVLSNTPAAAEAAVTVATARAKRSIAQFISEDIKSSNAVNQIADATNESTSFGQHVAEQINTNSRALLRGAYISSQQMQGDVMFVEITISQKSISGSQSLRKQIGAL